MRRNNGKVWTGRLLQYGAVIAECRSATKAGAIEEINNARRVYGLQMAPIAPGRAFPHVSEWERIDDTLEVQIIKLVSEGKEVL